MNKQEIAVLVQEKESLQTTVFDLKTRNKILEKQAQYAQEEYERLLHIIQNANRDRYGQKSERYIDDENNQQLSLLETVETAEITTSEKDNTETISYKRKKRRRKDQYQKLPRKEVIIEVAEEKRTCDCGRDKQLVRYEVTEKLHYEPAIFEIRKEKREVLACPKGCEKSIVTAKAPQVALPKVAATEELLSHIAVSKILDRQPLYHLEKQFESRYQVNISRKTMASWMVKMAQAFQPLINLLKDSLLSYDIGSFDATTIQVLKEPDRPATRKSYAYCARGGPPGKEVVLYEYNAQDHKQFLKDYFEGYKGYLHSDAAPIFNELEAEGLITLSYCNAHARRRFEKIAKTAKRPGLAKEAMDYYKRIYALEREAKKHNLSPTERYQLRQEKTKPIMDKFKNWLDENISCVLPKSPIGQAIAYCLNHWSGLNKFLNDGRLEADNNLTEQQIKYFVMGRKNFLFCDSVDGADALAIHYGLMLTAKHHGWDPKAYYVRVLKQIPHCESLADFTKLLPWNMESE